MYSVYVSSDGQDSVEIGLDQLTPSSVARVFSVSPTRTSLNVTSLMCLVFLFLYQIIIDHFSSLDGWMVRLGVFLV